MRVPFVDLKALHQPLKADFAAVFERVLDNNSFVLGPEVQKFETAFATYVGVQHCLAVNSGTSALQLALLALGIGPGDEVITVANTFFATAEAISTVGATPVFVDVDPVHYNMDPGLLSQAVTSKTRAVIPVHLYGQTADMDPILAIAKAHNLYVIEDACQAHGALYKGRKAGSMGTMACFSFYPGKNLGALGEGGAVVCNNAELAQKVRMLRDHGSTVKYEHSFPGYNYRLEGLQGGFLAAKLPTLDRDNERRRTAAKLYGELLAGAKVVTPAVLTEAQPVFHLYIIQSERRDALKQHLNEKGIETGLHYPIPLHLQQAYAYMGHKKGDFPVSEALARRILSLPMFPTISREQIEYVCAAVRGFPECQAATA